MMVSHGALLSDVYGTDNIKVKKKSKDKKKGKEKDINFFPEREMEKHIFPHQLEKVDVFDHSFHAKSNIMQFESMTITSGPLKINPLHRLV